MVDVWSRICRLAKAHQVALPFLIMFTFVGVEGGAADGLNQPFNVVIESEAGLCVGDFRGVKYVESTHKLLHNESHFVPERSGSRGAEAKSDADHLPCDGEHLLVLFPVWQGACEQELLGGRAAAGRAAWGAGAIGGE